MGIFLYGGLLAYLALLIVAYIVFDVGGVVAMTIALVLMRGLH